MELNIKSMDFSTAHQRAYIVVACSRLSVVGDERKRAREKTREA